MSLLNFVVNPFFFLLIFLSGCAKNVGINKDINHNEKELDPLERVNRCIFVLNRFLDMTILKPVAAVYDKVVPMPIKKCGRRIVCNIKTPIYMINYGLQGEGQKMSESMASFIINSTLGIGGLADPAKDVGLHNDTTGFSDTLKRWGVERGPYIMLPVLGPTTLRGVIGYGVDIVLDPLFWWDDYRYIGYVTTAYNFIDKRANLLETTEDIEKTSHNLYVTLRSLYKQKFLKNEQ